MNSTPNDPAKAKSKQGPHRFQPGQSGNPRGTALGSRHKATKLLDAIGERGAEGVLQATLQAAQSGDMVAARIILDRVWPARKGRATPVALPAITTPADLVQAMAALTAAVSDGSVTPDEALPVATLLDGHRKAIETAELAARIEALEKRA